VARHAYVVAMGGGLDPYARRRLVAGILVIILFLILLIGEAMRDRTLRRYAFAWLCVACAGLVGVVALVWLLVSPARAHDSQHPELNEWFMGLHAKGGAWCCSGDDADQPDDWRTSGDHYQALVQGEWINIDPDAVVNGMNKAEHALIWLKHLDGHPQARCFMPGTMS
jgi:hypothetical protein